MSTFIPRAFYLQLLKVVNLFFIVCGTILSIPAIGIFNPLPSFVPTGIIILLGMVFEAIVDYKRRIGDRAFNSKLAQRLVAFSDIKLRPNAKMKNATE